MMQIRNKVLHFVVALCAVPSLSYAVPTTVSQARAAELNLHRIDRLVTLKKIDAGYLDSFVSMNLEKLESTEAGKPSFRVRSFQETDEGAVAHMLDIDLDENGKPLSFSATAGVAKPTPYAWQDKDPVTIAENALHFIQDNANLPEIAPFNADFKSLTLRPMESQGRTVAQVDITISDAKKSLRVLLGLDGVYISHVILTH